MGVFDEHVQDIELVPYFMFTWEIAEKFRELYQSAETQHDLESMHKSDIENQLFFLHTKNPLLKSRTSTVPRFIYSWQLSDGSVWPDPEKFDSEALIHFMERMKNTKNAFLSTRYANFLFENIW
jgi:hypothetical protein